MSAVRLICILTITTLLFFFNRPLIAEDHVEQITLKTFNEDVTGDGIHDEIILSGTLLSNKSNYFQDVSVYITSLFSQRWQISLEGGYEPELFLLDFTHDQTAELFYKTKKSDDPSANAYQLYTLKEAKVKQLRLPVKQHVKNSYLDHFKAEVYLQANKKPLKLDLSFNRQNYLEEKLYDEDGQLLRNEQLIVLPIHSFTPVLISQSKGYGLTSYQFILDAVTKDVLGSIQTLWYYENDDWIIINTKWGE